MSQLIQRIVGSGRGLWSGTAVAIAACIALVLLVPAYQAQEFSQYVIYGLLALSLVLVWGWGGIFSFGQTAFFGVGAYCYGIVSINVGEHELVGLAGLAAACVGAAVVAGLLGYFMFYGNVGEVYVAIITLAATLVLLTVTSSMADPSYRVGDAVIGGYNGMLGIPPLYLPVLGYLDERGFLAFCLLIAGLVGLTMALTRRRPFGRIVLAINDNETRASLLGYDPRRYRLVVFVAGGCIAGVAGGLFASWSMFISPPVFSLGQAALLLIWTLVGGRESILGAFVGVLVVQRISTVLGEGGGSYTPIVLGALLIVVVLLFPAGIVPSLVKLVGFSRGWARRKVAVVEPGRSQDEVMRSDGAAAHRHRAEGPLSTAELRAIGLGRTFGGVHAVKDVSLSFPAEGVLCLIGPNGAGKSTFFNLLSGRLTPSNGSVLFGPQDITRLRPARRARLGVGIKLQVPSVFPSFTVEENLWLASYATTRDAATARARALEVLSRVQLAHVRRSTAADLPHGTVQWLEIGMVHAGHPAVMLLDEPTAGMGHADAQRTAALILELARDTCVVVVEHDMDFVRALGSPVVMFHQGEIFRSGSIESLQADEAVLDVYLGRGVSR